MSKKLQNAKVQKCKIKKGDSIVVIAGKDKGREGAVLSIIKRKPKPGRRTPGFRVLVEGVNIVKRHVRANPNQDKPGGILQKEAPIDISNVQILNKSTGKADRIKYKTLEDGRKVRVYRSSDELIDV